VADYFDRVFLINVRPSPKAPWRRPSPPRRCGGLWRPAGGDPCRRAGAVRIAGVTPGFSTRFCFRRATTPRWSRSARPARFAAGAGTFLFLRKRALVSDAIAHATLPGVGRRLHPHGGAGRRRAQPGGPAARLGVQRAVGLLLIQWIVARTRLTEDAAIGAVLGVFFGFGIVLLTVIQSMSSGRQAGLEGFLLGSTAGMLRQDAIVIACGRRSLALALIWAAAAADDAGGLRRRVCDGGRIQCLEDRPDDDGLGPCRHGDRPEGRGARPHRRAVDHPAGRGAVLDRAGRAA
jgi:hypothetical protein